MVSINEELWPGLTESASQLPRSEDSFLEGEFGGQMTPLYYQRRLSTIGFVGRTHVLDAGCGMGQWTVALARLNDQVSGIDPSDSRIRVARTLADSDSLHNVRLMQGTTEDLPFPDRAFDGVFCYSVLMFTDIRQTVAEFARVLKPGGILYVNANDIGWYLHLLIDRGIKRHSNYLIKQSIKMMMAPVSGRRRNRLVTSNQLRKILERNGFSIVAMGPEGSVKDPVRSQPNEILPPKYPQSFYGFQSMVEALCVRN